MVTARHLRLLLILTLIIQGAMYLGYPLPATDNDDNQAAQSYMIGELLGGNLLIGNLRYNTGYAYMLAPARALTRTLGSLDDRAILLAQVLAFSSIPFAVYDMMRRRFDARTAFITALIVLADPFALQWAHFQLPEWLIAVVAIWALWLTQLSWSASNRRRFQLVALASLGLGFMVIARLNVAPLMVIYGVALLFWRHINWRERMLLFMLVGAIGAGILVLYVILIQIPSTGGGRLSCTSGTTLLSSVTLKGLPARASNGPHSARYAALLTLNDTQGAAIKPGQYRYWRIPGPWVDEATREAFFNQPMGEVKDEIDIVYPGTLFTYLGPCPLDALLSSVALEAISRYPGTYLRGTVKDVVDMLILHPTELIFPPQYLDSPQDIDFTGDGALGVYRANSRQYKGQRVWKPGIIAYSNVFPILNLLKLLTPFAIVASLWKRDWLLATTAMLYLVCLLVIAAAATSEPRYFAMASPLGALLIGWFLARLFQRLEIVQNAEKARRGN